jgi:hypothetical protein
MATIGPLFMSVESVSKKPRELESNGGRTLDEALEERLGRQVGIVLLEVLLARGDELQGDELEAVSWC